MQDEFTDKCYFPQKLLCSALWGMWDSGVKQDRRTINTWKYLFPHKDGLHNKGHCWLRNPAPLQHLWEHSLVKRAPGTCSRKLVFQRVKQQNELLLWSRYPQTHYLSCGCMFGWELWTFWRKTVKHNGLVKKVIHATLSSSLHKCRVNTHL